MAEYCTFSDSERFYSYRRDGRRVAWPPLLWLEKWPSREWPFKRLFTLVMAFGGHVLLPSRLRGQAAIGRSFSSVICY